MRVLVCGGRDMDKSTAFNWLEANAYMELAHISGCYSANLCVTHLIQGGARGADEGGKMWGESEGAKILEFRANWKKHGKAAGPIRNRQMITEGKPDCVIALPGGKGTANMIKTAYEHDIPVIEVKW